MLRGASIHITGIVQGVGFRPFVYGLAIKYALNGWVRNTSAGVEIEVDGPLESINLFVQDLQAQAPPLAHIDSISKLERPPDGYTNFEIISSVSVAAAFQPISPDVSTCPDCLRELFDPKDRRYRYPFINCTNCGPRFTIIQDIPYDRPNTTMAGFPLCPACASEYHDPLDRRFHAQPVACPDCGPKIWLEYNFDSVNHDSPVNEALPAGDEALYIVQHLLSQGKIVAIKGLGGFHLACDATILTAVDELRKRKLRVDKPFALMASSLEAVEEHCYMADLDKDLLTSHQRPIVILKKWASSKIAPDVAPRQDTLGMMLPYTPLHHLLFANPSIPENNTGAPLKSELPAQVLVMTSGNLSEEPIAIENQEARQRLASLADAFLMHNRPIRTRCDDSVMRVFTIPASISKQKRDSTFPKERFSGIYPLRRSRGYTPYPIHLPWEVAPLLATGGELKNTFCLARDGYAFLSQHIGDMQNYETYRSFEDGIALFERLFRIQPQALAYDLHPNYLATRYALQRAEQQNLPALGIQHQHAHVCACMVEHSMRGDEKVIGVAFDGTGYGDDGAIWGGEFLIADYLSYRRVSHLAYVPLPGGDASARKPARLALAYLWNAGMDWNVDLPSVAYLCVEERQALRAQLERRINTPLTSSMGRLFDGVSALCGIRQEINYEAQAAIELEALADPQERGAYTFELPELTLVDPSSLAGEVGMAPVVKALVEDLQREVSVPVIAARFHNSIAQMVSQVASSIRNQSGIGTVVLSGGVWQNHFLLAETISQLESAGFSVFTHSLAPTNDGGIALGQAAIAAYQFRKE